MNITTSFRDVRLARGGGLREYARLLDVNPGYLSKFERGLVDVSTTRLFEIARAYGIDPGDLEDAWLCRDCDAEVPA